MTMDEILMLLYGVALGSELTSLLHIYWSRRDERRARSESAVARHRAAGDLFFSSFRLYRLQQRTGVRR
ncbi:hypothetical protein ACFZDK_24810 [Streptomyces sp. NPDC007901]|uniref:hypothetical protein n=1 Tax=Streptomyces sp. NPDC007901 TaxID=3364785 RepID=UPI0036E9F05C